MATEMKSLVGERSKHRRRLLIVFIITFGYLVVEVIGGLLTEAKIYQTIQRIQEHKG